MSSGLYAEQATREVTNALDQLIFSLGEYRLEVLGRENDQNNIDPLYAHFDRAERALLRLMIARGVDAFVMGIEQFHLHIIQRLLTHTGRPPELWLPDHHTATPRAVQNLHARSPNTTIVLEDGNNSFRRKI